MAIEEMSECNERNEWMDGWMDGWMDEWMKKESVEGNEILKGRTISRSRKYRFKK